MLPGEVPFPDDDRGTKRAEIRQRRPPYPQNACEMSRKRRKKWQKEAKNGPV